MSTAQKQEVEIRKNIIEDGKVVDCIVALPSNLFYNVTIPVCLWFLSRKRDNRKDKILFIDARKMGVMETRKHRILEVEEIQKICTTYHNWRDGKEEYQDEQGFCKSASLDEIRNTGDYMLTPGRYVGTEAQEEDGELFDEKMARLTSELGVLFENRHNLEKEVRNKLGAIGYEI